MKYFPKSPTATIVATIISASFLLATPLSFAAQEQQTEKTETQEKAETKKSNQKQDVKNKEEKASTEATPTEIAAEIESNSQSDSVELKEHKHDYDDDSNSWHFHCHNDEEGDDCDSESFDFQISDNTRDGFYLGMSGISSSGDDYSLVGDEKSSSEFDVDFSYRVQLLGFFMESPGLSSRRMHGMYSISAWGYNFYDGENWTFDLFYQNSTRGIDGLKEIQIRNKDKRGGLRATGYFDNSQLQLIFSPVSGNDEGSDGIEASISYSINWQIKNWSFYTNLGAKYRSEEILAYDQASLPVDYDSSNSAGISTSAEIGIEYPLSTDWVLGGFAGYNSLSDRSIAIRTDDVEDGYRAGLLLTYVF